MQRASPSASGDERCAGGSVKRGFSFGESDDFADNLRKTPSTSTTSKPRYRTCWASTTNV